MRCPDRSRCPGNATYFPRVRASPAAREAKERQQSASATPSQATTAVGREDNASWATFRVQPDSATGSSPVAVRARSAGYELNDRRGSRTVARGDRANGAVKTTGRARAASASCSRSGTCRAGYLTVNTVTSGLWSDGYTPLTTVFGTLALCTDSVDTFE